MTRFTWTMTRLPLDITLLTLTMTCVHGFWFMDDFKRRHDPDEGKTISELIVSRGFGEQHYSVTTEDGYILGVYRIVNGKLGIVHRRPVVLQHGFMVSAMEFIMNPGGHIDEKLPPGHVGNNLAFELAKRGFDVWLFNSRGNKYSKRHAWLNPSLRKYWDFSKDHMIKYDLPASIAFVQNITKQEKVAYIGHSQGSHLMFGLLASQPQYNDIIEPFISLAPVATVKHMSTFIRVLSNQKWLERLVMIRGGEFFKDYLIESFVSAFCKGSRSPFCANVVFLANGGVDSGQLNATRIPVYLSLIGWGTSWMNVVHWGQNAFHGRFTYFDFGPLRNKQIYGTAVAPEYDLSKITNRHMAFLSSSNDNMSTPRDMDLLRKTLTVKPMFDYVIPHDGFNHLDFAIGKDAGQFVVSKVLDILSNYTTHEQTAEH